ncbi:MAG: hypothetical protein ABR587_11035 [Candidatus Binatia bacterium]
MSFVRGKPGAPRHVAPLGSALLCIGMLAGLLTCSAHAQDLEPRAYANTPVGINFVGFGYSFSTGGVSADAAVPLENAEIDIHATALSYARSFGLFGQSAKAGVIMPCAWLQGSAVFDGVPVERDFQGLVDPVLKFSTNLLGAPAQSLENFAAYRPELSLGRRTLNGGTTRTTFCHSCAFHAHSGTLPCPLLIVVR